MLMLQSYIYISLDREIANMGFDLDWDAKAASFLAVLLDTLALLLLLWLAVLGRLLAFLCGPLVLAGWVGGCGSGCFRGCWCLVPVTRSVAETSVWALLDKGIWVWGKSVDIVQAFMFVLGAIRTSVCITRHHPFAQFDGLAGGNVPESVSIAFAVILTCVCQWVKVVVIANLLLVSKFLTDLVWVSVGRAFDQLWISKLTQANPEGVESNQSDKQFHFLQKQWFVNGHPSSYLYYPHTCNRKKGTMSCSKIVDRLIKANQTPMVTRGQQGHQRSVNVRLFELSSHLDSPESTEESYFIGMHKLLLHHTMGPS